MIRSGWFAICISCNRGNVLSMDTQKQRDDWLLKHCNETGHTDYEINIVMEPVKS